MMRTLRRLWSRLAGTFVGGRGDRELAEELEFHVQQLAAENQRRGLSAAEAERQARLRFGSVESAKESYRDQRGLPLLDVLMQDVRYAVRGLRGNRGFAAVTILSLAIGIGSNTAIFSLVHSVLLRPLAYHEPDRVFMAREVTTLGPGAVNPVHAREWAKDCRLLEQVALIRSNPGDVGGDGEPVSVRAADVAHNLFALLGVEPMLGRTFLPEEEEPGKDRVVILSESLWRSRFDGDRALVGREIVVDRQKYQVVGIMPDWFRLPSPQAGVRVEMFRPLALTKEELARVNGNFNYAAIVRVRPGGTKAQAIAEMNVVQARFRRPSGFSKDLKADLMPVHEAVTGRARTGLWMLASAVGAVLLIVCINLANLLLSRMASRKREAAIRTALGASRGRQFGMVMTESLLLAVCGGGMGILPAVWCVQLLVGTTTLGIPRLYEVRVDVTVLAFACCLTLLTAVVFGGLPAWRLAAGDPQDALRAGSHTVTEGRKGLRLREGLIGMEVALSAALLIVAGLLTSSIARLLRVDKGFEAAQVLTVDVGLSGEAYREPASRERFFGRVLAKVRAIPGIEAAGMITYLPTLGQTWNDPIYLEGAPRDQWHTVDNRYASPGYFRALHVPLVRGRYFEESDRGQHVAVLSEKAARLLWPGDLDPVGRRFMGEDDQPKLLVGVVAEVRADLAGNPPPMAYYPYWQRAPGAMSLVVRAAGGSRTVAGAVRAALREEDAQMPIAVIRGMEDVVDQSVAPRRFQLTLMGVFAAAALVVACLGIYGVVSYSVAQRRNEIGIRMALGAQRRQVLGLVVRQGMIPVIVGLASGVALALAMGSVIRGLLFEVQPGDPLTIGGVAVLLLAAGAVACVLPARRAVRSDASSALRFE